MRWERHVPESISQWCLWACFASIATVIAALGFAVLAGAVLGTGVANTLLLLTLSGAAGAIGLFAVGCVCSLAGR